MHTENTIEIRGDKARIFALGAAIGDWVTILPHYRYVRVSFDDGRVKQAEMGATRDGFPVRWRTSQIVLPEEDRIIFVHTGGITRGMYVEWNLTPVAEKPGYVRVVISHELTCPLPLLTNWFVHSVVGEMFVANIAGKTLARIKEIVEQEAK